MIKKILAFILFAAIAAILLQGCAPAPTHNVTRIDQGPEPSGEITKLLSADVVGANNQFAEDLYSRYSAKEGNVFFSSYSIESALAMTYEGARGRTAEEMQVVLHLPDDKDQVRSDFTAMNSRLNKADKRYQLSVANALWAQSDYTCIDSYFTDVETYYGGKATKLDFRKETEKSRLTINKWVEDKTQDKIKDLIPKGILDDMTRLVLTNAIYFKANWSKQFDADNTHDSQFFLSSGETTNVRMMHQTSHFNYAEDEEAQMLEMDYLGNDLSMLIILPKDKTEETVDLRRLKELKGSLKDYEVVVALPKFKFETKYFMAQDLKDMGMPTAFRYPYADFTGISPATPDSPNGELYISEVIHQTFIEVAEYGTEAAAATAVVMRAGAMAPPPERKYFTADHPFTFIIQEKSSGNILFMGRLSSPGK